MSVKVDKIPYTLQFCDTAGQVSFFFIKIAYFQFSVYIYFHESSNTETMLRVNTINGVHRNSSFRV